MGFNRSFLGPRGNRQGLRSTAAPAAPTPFQKVLIWGWFWGLPGPLPNLKSRRLPAGTKTMYKKPMCRLVCLVPCGLRSMAACKGRPYAAGVFLIHSFWVGRGPSTVCVWAAPKPFQRGARGGRPDPPNSSIPGGPKNPIRTQLNSHQNPIEPS